MSGQVTLRVEPLSREAFAPFGEVIATDGAAHYPINDGMAERYHDLARIETEGEGAHPLVSIFRGRPWPFPLEVRMVERHPLGSQAFVPLSDRPFLIVVADTDDPPLPEDLCAFAALPGEGVNYRAGIWHHPLIALEEVSDFLVIDRGGPGKNLEEHHFAGPCAVIVQPAPR